MCLCSAACVRQCILGAVAHSRSCNTLVSAQTHVKSVHHFGAVCDAAGDVGINPENGQYRLSGEVAGVEVNELRKTLAIRPTPYSVSGAVRGVLHVSGPLEQPIFSGQLISAYHCMPMYHCIHLHPLHTPAILHTTAKPWIALVV